MKYSTEKKKRKALTIVMAMTACAVIGAAGLMLLREDPERKTWDTMYPMANAQVSWRQTFYGGGRK